MGILRLFQKATNIGFDEEEGILCAQLNCQCCNVEPKLSMIISGYLLTIRI